MAKRGRPSKPKEERTGLYFYTDEENAVVAYIKSNSAREKDVIFRTILEAPFTKMIESIIRRYFKDNISQEDFQLYFNDAMGHVIEKMVLYDKKRCKKAYSYIGTIVRNYVLSRLIDNRKALLRDAQFDDMSEELNEDVNYSYDINDQHSSDMTEIIEETTEKINDLITDGTQKITYNEMLVGKALVEIMSNWDDVFTDLGSNKFNKSSMLLYLKETTNLSTNEVRSSMRKFKNVYNKTKENVYV